MIRTQIPNISSNVLNAFQNSLLENRDNDMVLKLTAINKRRLSDVWGPS